MASPCSSASTREQPQSSRHHGHAIHDISVAIDSMRRGAYDYLLKPFEREHLVATVQRALDHRQALQESQTYQQNLEQVVRARTEMLRQAMEDLEHSYDVTLEALGDALDLKDSETEGHSKRVTAYTIALARAMGISPAEIKVIARGAFLHDIGKMAIPDEILRKPGKLTPKKQADHARALRARLPDAAQDSVSRRSGGDRLHPPGTLRRQRLSKRAARQRNSRRRPHICGGRHAGRHHQRPSLSQGAQLRCMRGEEIIRCSGTQFDPAVVEVYLKIPNELWHELRSEITGAKPALLHLRFLRRTRPVRIILQLHLI